MREDNSLYLVLAFSSLAEGSEELIALNTLLTCRVGLHRGQNVANISWETSAILTQCTLKINHLCSSRE